MKTQNFIILQIYVVQMNNFEQVNQVKYKENRDIYLFYT